MAADTDASPSAPGGATSRRGALIECMLALCRQFSAERQHKVIECVNSELVLHSYNLPRLAEETVSLATS